MIDGDAVPLLRLRGDRVVARHVGDEIVVLDLQSSSYLSVRGVGVHIWEILSATPMTSVALVDHLLEEYDVEHAALTADVDRFVGSLVEAGLVEL